MGLQVWVVVGLIIFVHFEICYGSSDENIYLSAPSNATGPRVLIVFVPGALVPIVHYVATVQAIQNMTSQQNIAAYAVIVHCVENLCYFGSNHVISKAIESAFHTWNTTFQPDHTVVLGHSLGSSAAKKFVDDKKNVGFAGVGMLGVCLNGDVGGISGYPEDLASYHTPLLALAGELDFTPISHVALLYQQWLQMSNINTNTSQLYTKVPIVVPSMDHSDFCPGYFVPWDIQSELSANVATSKIGAIVGSWISILFQGTKSFFSSISILSDALKQSGPMLQPFLDAFSWQQQWCPHWQLHVADNDGLKKKKVRVSHLIRAKTLEQLTISHTSYHNDDDWINVTDVTYDEKDVWDFKGNIAGALQVGCKAISRDRINSIISNTTTLNTTEPFCRELNDQAVAMAYALLNASWPQALVRNAKHGGGFVLENDQMVTSGPVWVLERLKFDRKMGSKDATVGSVALVTSLDSFVYPGVHYCKLLSPARAVEWLQTVSLTNRYNNETARQY